MRYYWPDLILVHAVAEDEDVLDVEQGGEGLRVIVGHGLYAGLHPAHQLAHRLHAHPWRHKN